MWIAAAIAISCRLQDQLSSNPELSNFNVRQFSVTVRTILSGAPCGKQASISRVIRTFASARPAKCAITSSATRLASLPTRVGSRGILPWNRRGIGETGTDGSAPDGGSVDETIPGLVL